MSDRRQRQVAVLIESSRAYGRGLIEGVMRYSREHGDWSLSFEPRGLEAPPPWLFTWRGDGILARLPRVEMARAVAAKGLPVVDLYSSARPSGLPMVGGDNPLIAQLALDHFWERGLRYFAYCGLPPEENRYIAQRGEAFARLTQAAGGSCTLFDAETSALAVPDWEREQERIAAWLRGLPKPVGVLACFDERGFQVINACGQAGLRVPEEVAVLAVGNDTLLCEMATPPLSSIDLDAHGTGYEAAALLDRLMDGARPPRRPICIAPRGVVARHSTDVLAVEDADVAAALRFIRERAADGLRVEDVLRHVAVSSSVLERKFRRFLGRTPKAELLRVQMARARELLAETDLPLKELAQRCGFAGEKYFSDAFCRVTGVRPGVYRRQRRGGGR
ncbi:MAG: XylR family transcriptional regulator [Planctomycetia bacterium]|nr:XylR family transcriptional regulator [Planctomycetia bacterium]